MYFTEINDFVQQKMLYISQLEIKRSVQYEVVLVPVIQKKKMFVKFIDFVRPN